MRNTISAAAICMGMWMFLYACKDQSPGHAPIPAFDETGVNLVAEYPAGTLISAEAALPAPGNLGYIPSTLGEDGIPLRCILVGDAAKANSIQKVLPIAAVQWRLDGRTHTIIVSVQATPEQRSCPVEDFMALRLEYDFVRLSLELWFRHNFMPPNAEWLGWQNEVYAEEEVYRSARRFAERD